MRWRRIKDCRNKPYLKIQLHPLWHLGFTGCRLKPFRHRKCHDEYQSYDTAFEIFILALFLIKTLRCLRIGYVSVGMYDKYNFFLVRFDEGSKTITDSFYIFVEVLIGWYGTGRRKGKADCGIAVSSESLRDTRVDVRAMLGIRDENNSRLGYLGQC